MKTIYITQFTTSNYRGFVVGDSISRNFWYRYYGLQLRQTDIETILTHYYEGFKLELYTE